MPAAAPRARLCVLTPDALGAVAVIRLWGPDALSVADAAFRPARGTRLAATPTGRPRLGRVGAGLGDEVVAVVVPCAEFPEVEIHCHGGPAPVSLVVDALVAAGAERRQPVAWVRHDARSTVSAEATVDLARAETVRTAEILLEQSQGALEGEVNTAVDHLARADRPSALNLIDQLIVNASVGLRLIDGWTVALAGRPNVGKSRLLNALAGYDRAIVDATPGTTRDVVTVRTALGGWPVEIADTAGLRDSSDPLESAGIALGLARQAKADLTLLVLDVSEPLTDDDRALLLTHRTKAGLVVASKSDLTPAWNLSSEADGLLPVSSLTGAGLDRLSSELARRLVPNCPPPLSGVPFRPRHLRVLLAARDAIIAGDAAEARDLLTAGFTGRPS